MRRVVDQASRRRQGCTIIVSQAVIRCSMAMKRSRVSENSFQKIRLTLELLLILFGDRSIEYCPAPSPRYLHSTQSMCQNFHISYNTFQRASYSGLEDVVNFASLLDAHSHIHQVGYYRASENTQDPTQQHLVRIRKCPQVNLILVWLVFFALSIRYKKGSAFKCDPHQLSMLWHISTFLPDQCSPTPEKTDPSISKMGTT